jgi:hypothetical protein
LQKRNLQTNKCKEDTQNTRTHLRALAHDFVLEKRREEGEKKKEEEEEEEGRRHLGRL